MDFGELPFKNEQDNLDDTLPFEPINSSENSDIPPLELNQKNENNEENKELINNNLNDDLSDPFENLSISQETQKNENLNKNTEIIENINILSDNIDIPEIPKETEQSKLEAAKIDNKNDNNGLENALNIMPIFAFVFVSILGIYIFSLNVRAEQVNLIKIEEKNKVGYIDNTGEILIKPKYVSGTDFYKGYAIVQNYNNLSGVINGKAKLEVPFGNYFYIDLYKNRYIASKFTKQGLKQGLLDSNLEEITRFDYDRISYSKTGLFLFTRGEKMGIMNSNGKEIYTYEVDEVDDRNISIEVSEMKPSKEKYKYARIKVNSSSTIVNVETGLEVYKYTLNDIYVLDNNVFYTKTKNGNNRYIVINDDKVVYETSSYRRVKVENPNSGIAICITEDAKYDYINLKTGEKINSNVNIGYNYSDGVVLISKHNFNNDKDEYSTFSNNKTIGTFNDVKVVDNVFVNGYGKILTNNNKYNFVSIKGKILSDKEYESVSDFSSYGYAVVSNNGEYGLIDKNGDEILSIKYEEIEMFKEEFFEILKQKTGKSLFKFKIDNKYGIIDSNGTIIIKPIYESIDIITNKYPIIKVKYNKEELLINLENKSEIIVKEKEDVNIYENHIIVGKNYYNYDGKVIYTTN